MGTTCGFEVSCSVWPAASTQDLASSTGGDKVTDSANFVALCSFERVRLRV